MEMAKIAPPIVSVGKDVEQQKIIGYKLNSKVEKSFSGSYKTQAILVIQSNNRSSCHVPSTQKHGSTFQRPKWQYYSQYPKPVSKTYTLQSMAG